MILPFIADAPASIRPSFRTAIDSLSTSGHKMIGTPMPCSVLIARRKHVARAASAISYLRSNDTTLMASRSGHAVLALWDRITRHGISGYSGDIAGCLSRCDRFVAALRRMGIPVLRNPSSPITVLPAPCDDIARTYQLACIKGQTRAVVMPNVGDALIDRFLADYGAWWRRAAKRES
jgi:histidine decarboxylase